jgi:hypothetical protein
MASETRTHNRELVFCELVFCPTCLLEKIWWAKVVSVWITRFQDGGSYQLFKWDPREMLWGACFTVRTAKAMLVGCTPLRIVTMGRDLKAVQNHF